MSASPGPTARAVLDPCSLAFEPGDRVGVVGPNGAGKSTLLDLIAGRLQPTAGSVERGATVQIGYYDQLGRDLDLTQRVREAVAGDKGEPSLADVDLMRRFWFDGDAQFAPIGTLSGGERRRLQLLLTLVQQPNVLLLDEPTNDLDLDTLRALEDFLDDWPGIVVDVSHDRAFLDRVTDELLALDGSGGVRWIRGGVGAWLAQRAQSPVRSECRRCRRRPARRQRQSCRSEAGLRVAARRRFAASSARPNATLAAAVDARDGLAAEMAARPTPIGSCRRWASSWPPPRPRSPRPRSRWLALAAEAEAPGPHLREPVGARTVATSQSRLA